MIGSVVTLYNSYITSIQSVIIGDDCLFGEKKQ